MRIVFINAILGGDFSALDIAITQLATYLNKRTHHKAAIIDLTFHRRGWKSYLHKKIRKLKPDIIGFSCNTMYMQYVKIVMGEIKKKHDIPLILGGHHASIRPEETLMIDEADFVLTGDAEYTLAEFLDRLEGNKPYNRIEGLYWKEKGKARHFKDGCFNSSLDRFPAPDWDLWEDLDKYFYFLGMLYVIGSRGCPYRCTYCDAHGLSKYVGGKYYRMRDPRGYAREIAAYWKKYEPRGMRLLQCFDPVFTLDKHWLSEFCDEYKKRADVKTQRFSVFSRIDNLDEEKISLLARSGCALLRVGIEAGDEFIRNRVYNKNISNAQIKKIFRLCKRAGIGFTAYYMLGGPGESRATINKTISLARQLDAERSAFFIFKPFTEESLKLISELGDRIDEKRWRQADNITFDAVVRLKDLSPLQVELLQMKAYFFTLLKRMGRMLKRQHIFYLPRLMTYLTKGAYYGLELVYLLPYYHVYGYDNVDK